MTLFAAVEEGDLPLLERLVQGGDGTVSSLAKGEQRDKGRAPLHVAALAGHQPILAYLLRSCHVNASTERDRRGMTALLCAHTSLA